MFIRTGHSKNLEEFQKLEEDALRIRSTASERPVCIVIASNASMM